MATRTAAHRLLIREGVGRKEWMDFVKGAAIMLVVLYHTMLFLRSIEFEGGGMGRAKVVLELFPMPAFFLIAGMFHFRVVDWTLAQTWQRRLAGYLYLYVLWSVLRFAFYVALPSVREDGAGESAHDPLALLGILVWPISSYWFIYALFIFTALVWLGRRMPAWVQLALTAALSMAFSSGLVTALNVGWDRMGEYLLFFVLGVVGHKGIADAVARVRWWQVVALLGLAAALAAALAFLPVAGRIPGIALAGQLVAVAFGFAAASKLVMLRPLSWVTYLGVRSLHIYLLHIFVIAGLTFAVRAIPDLQLLPGRGFIVLTVLTVIVLIVSVLLGRVLSRVTWLFVIPQRFRPGSRGFVRPRRPGAPPAAVAQPDAPETTVQHPSGTS